MKKIIILICLLFITGCDATYRVTINNNKVKENIKVIETDKSLFDSVTDTGWTLREVYGENISYNPYHAENYKFKSLNNENQLGSEYTSRDLEGINDLTFLSQCYENPSVSTEDSIVTINTGNEFNCYDYYDNLGNIKVIFETNHKVISTNADTIENGSYIWNITKDSNKQIEISYDSSITKTNYTIYIIKKMKNKNRF